MTHGKILSGLRAEALRDILQYINVPEGFEVSLYAVVPDARSMAMAPQGTVLFAGTRKDKMWSIVDRDRDRVADEVKDFAPSITFDVPNGPCFSPDGFLYIAERNRVLVFPAAEFFFEGPSIRATWSRPRKRASTTRHGSATSGPTACSTFRSASRITCSRSKSSRCMTSWGLAGSSA